MKNDAFSKYHPAVNLLFFVQAICCGVLLQHPVYLLAGLAASGIYYLLLHGEKGWKTVAGTLPLFAFITLLNPVINTRGATVLFQLFGRPYTLEALIYGVAVAATFVVTVLWFGCGGNVLTADKLIGLFGDKLPALSILFVMVLRMIPNLLRKARQVSGAREGIGKGTNAATGLKDRWTAAVTTLGILISWALEGSVVTGDSMRSRGYGTAKRTGFCSYRMTKYDWLLLAVMQILIGVVILFAVKGGMSVVFLPERNIAPVKGANIIGFTAYLGYLLIPTVLQIKEVIQWNISRSGI